MPSTQERPRNEPIDFLRGVAILLVLLLHFTLTYHMEDTSLGRLSPKSVEPLLNGNYGVTIFFVISGFLITSISISRFGSLQRIRLASFYAFRFARLVPSLLLALTIITTLGCLGVPSFTNSDGGHHLPNSYFVLAVISILTFWHNVLMESAGYFNYCLNIYWSLSVEEVFYLTFPAVCVLLRANGLIVAVSAALVACGPIYRSSHVGNELFFMYGNLACFDAIAFGCLAALVARTLRPNPKYDGWTGRIAALCLALAYWRGIDGHEVWGFTQIAAATAVMLVTAVRRAPGGWMEARLMYPLRWMGRYSYELYLFHIIVLACVRDLIPEKQLSSAFKLPLLVVFAALSALVAGLVARYFSEPLNETLRRWYLAHVRKTEAYEASEA